MTLHPSLAVVRRGVRAVLDPLDPGATVVVACSGGADSIALLSASLFEGHKRSLRVVGVTVDHGLQPGSALQAQRVVEQMAAMGADETMTATVTVDATGVGPEAAARQARYAVLSEVASRLSASVVLLGHTLDDRAETVLLGLTRGSGGRSLAGMRRGFEGFARPLLDVRRDDTVTACQVEGLTVWDDPHNVDPTFTRVRVRRTILPLLEDELGPGVARTLARTADQLRDDMALLDSLADSALARVAGPHGLSVPLLGAEPPALRRRVIRLAAVAAGAPPGELFHEHVLAVDALLTDWRGQKWIDLPGHLRAVRREALLVLERAPSSGDPSGDPSTHPS
ncbi:tRNA lysidine(34) synthetase TilS [Nocardioides sp. B-3]|uniref:tRNA lysidine(34) synthetase TilS n=1 Tax=Nocardioides sp. B-3 TaxID=2895565 RepID=UPI0021530941|nr:tRNA lysidine(34) synthetase TilS [Nocardioides sp. B-3]UUZ60811.1 tRNA lysidine(34) synthetase TilS [Nocardioides sp. B-3]